MSETDATGKIISENNQLDQTMPKKGGPYPIHIKKKRRDEVFRLHFDYGYSARKISKMMNVSRNTINSDVLFCYAKLSQDTSNIYTDDWLNKILYRLDSQRTRFMERLDKTSDIGEILPLEKMILGIDSKLVQTILKIRESKLNMYDNVNKLFNQWLEENGHKERYVLWGTAIRVSKNTSAMIKHIIKLDKYQKSNKQTRVRKFFEKYGAQSQAQF